MTWKLESAACNGRDPSVFFPVVGPGGNKAYDEARTICAGCPVIDACRAYIMSTEGLKHDERHGFWAGMTPRERYRLSGRRRAA